ncbi:MAG: DUF2231 domain-containing protein [Bacteroidota bacterium]
MPDSFHPISVHFPIAFLILSGGLYIYSLFQEDIFYFRSGKMLHVLGVVGLVIAMLTGRSASSEIGANDPLADLLDTHELLGYAAIWAFSMLLVWVYLREKAFPTKRKEAGLFAFVYLLFLFLMSYSSYLGGEMVHS